MRHIAIAFLLLGCLAGAAWAADGDWFLMTSHGDEKAGLLLAVSRDGLTWQVVNDDASVLKPTVGEVFRDPSIARGKDGTYHLVWTIAWACGTYKGFGYTASRDLIHWDRQRIVPVMQNEPKTEMVWAPELFRDDQNDRWMIHWSSSVTGKFPETLALFDGRTNPRIYYNTTRDFKTFSASRLLFNPGCLAIDSHLYRATDGQYYVFFKADRKSAPRRGILMAKAPAATGPYAVNPNMITPSDEGWAEGPCALRVGDVNRLYYAPPNGFGAFESKDMKGWSNIRGGMSVPGGYRHGTVIRISSKEARRLLNHDYSQDGKAGGQAYVFSYFRDNGQHGFYLAYSRDGLNWTPLNNQKPFLKPEVGGKLMRDPCIIQGPDGAFHMVWTTSWTDKGIGVAHSPDLINWSAQKFVPVMQHEPGARNCWAPEITWDAKGKQYVIYWATTIPGRFPETEKAGDGGLNHRMYYVTTKDFKTYSKTKLFYQPGFNVIDSTIQPFGDGYVMILKDETRHPPAKSLKVAFSAGATGPWSKASASFTDGIDGWKEGPTLFKKGAWWFLMFDIYTKGRFGAMRTKDFKDWEDVTGRLNVPKGMRHGTVLPVSEKTLQALLKLK